MTAIEVDTTRLPLLLHDLRLPAIARLWPDFAERATRKAGPRHGYSPCSPSSRLPSVAVGVSSVLSSRRAYRQRSDHDDPKHLHKFDQRIQQRLQWTPPLDGGAVESESFWLRCPALQTNPRGFFSESSSLWAARDVIIRKMLEPVGPSRFGGRQNLTLSKGDIRSHSKHSLVADPFSGTVGVWDAAAW